MPLSSSREPPAEPSGAAVAPGVATATPPLSTGVKLRYGSAAFADNLAFNCVNQLANPVFNLVLGLNPALIGIALAIPRIIDAFTDPLVGLMSDNHRSRWGRRRGFIAVGAVMTGLSACSIWFAPAGHTPGFYFAYLLVFGLFLAISHSIFTVPYYALGVELTNDYRDRNSLMAWRAGFNKLSGVPNQWLFALSQLAIFGGILSGARALGIGIGIVVIALGLLPALTLREPEYAQVLKQRRLPFWSSFMGAFRHRDFRLLAFSNMSLLVSVMMVDALGLYLLIFQVSNGDYKQGALLKGITGTVFQLGGMFSLPLFTMLCRRWEKRVVCQFSIALVILAGVMKWFCYTAGAGWLVLVPSALLAPGLAAVLMLGPSMLADLCNVDEAETGMHREGMFVATFNWMLKSCMSIIMLFSGVVITLTGFKADLGVNQSPSTLLYMRLAFSGVTIVLALTSFVLIGRYRLTADRLRRLQPHAA